MTVAAVIVTSAAFIGAVFAIQAAAFVVSEQLGNLTLLPAVGVVIWSCWIVGPRFPRKYALVAAAYGALLGFTYCYLDWLLIRALLLDVLKKPDEVVVWGATLFSLLIWPTTGLCAIAAGVSSWRRHIQTRRSGAETSKRI